MLDNQFAIIRALDNGEKAQARRLLRPLLEREPTAELWYLAARASEKPQHEIACLERALALDPFHAQSRQRLLVLRDSQPLPTPAPERLTERPLPDAPRRTAQPMKPPAAAPAPADLPPLKKVGSHRKGGSRRTLGCLSLLLLSLVSSYFVLLVLGSGIPGQLRALLTGAQPPVVSTSPDAVYIIPPSQSKNIKRSETLSDILEPGYTHELRFMAERGEELVVALQFFSPTAQGVGRNVAVFDANGGEARERCLRDSILAGNTGVAFTCTIHTSGEWSLRVYGREGESTGAYFASVERF